MPFHLLVYIMCALVGWDVLTLFSTRLARLAMTPAVYRPLLGTFAVVVLSILGIVSYDMVLAGILRAGTAAMRVLQQAGDGGGTLMAMRHRVRLPARMSAQERRRYSLRARRARYRRYYADTQDSVEALRRERRQPVVQFGPGRDSQDPSTDEVSQQTRADSTQTVSPLLSSPE